MQKYRNTLSSSSSNQCDWHSPCRSHSLLETKRITSHYSTAESQFHRINIGSGQAMRETAVIMRTDTFKDTSVLHYVHSIAFRCNREESGNLSIWSSLWSCRSLQKPSDESLQQGRSRSWFYHSPSSSILHRKLSYYALILDFFKTFRFLESSESRCNRLKTYLMSPLSKDETRRVIAFNPYILFLSEELLVFLDQKPVMKRWGW
jgi:hypothetical protein